MHDLIIKAPGLTKKAAGEDGPSFEQQFGIVSNAVIADKFPVLDKDKLAFQLIEQEEGTQNAVGAAVYILGKTVIFVPAFYRNGKLHTGDMLYVPEMHTFLPMSDPWLAWLREKNPAEGELADNEITEASSTIDSAGLRELYDPITKYASIIWDKERLLKNAEAFADGAIVVSKLANAEDNGNKTGSLFETTLALGKKASENMLDNLVKDPDFMNAALHFYSGDDLDTFAKRASEQFADPLPEVELILPFDKQAKELSEKELNALYKDGYFIRKNAAADAKTPAVLRNKQLKELFSVVSGIGKTKLMTLDGKLTDAIILQRIEDGEWYGWSDDRKPGSGVYHGDAFENPTEHVPSNLNKLNASKYMGGSDKFAVIDGKLYLLPPDSVCASGVEELSADDIRGLGETLEAKKSDALEMGTVLVFPNGSAYRTDKLAWISSIDGWADGSLTVVIGHDDLQSAPVVSNLDKHALYIVAPKNTRVVRSADVAGDQWAIPTFPAVTVSTLPVALAEYCADRYHKVKIYSNGDEYIVSDENSDSSDMTNVKTAAFDLVSTYGIDPAVAKVMLKEAHNGASSSNPRVSHYFIEKHAYEDTVNPPASIGYQEKLETNPTKAMMQMPAFDDTDPQKLTEAVERAAGQGIKEVFDVAALKLLCQQTRVFEEISEDIPLFMQTLDSLCRKLFQFYWHTDKLADKYGTIKLKALEDSIKTALDTLSELTIFFKLRTVDTSGISGEEGGDLMSGKML